MGEGWEQAGRTGGKGEGEGQPTVGSVGPQDEPELTVVGFP